MPGQSPWEAGSEVGLEPGEDEENLRREFELRISERLLLNEVLRDFSCLSLALCSRRDAPHLYLEGVRSSCPPSPTSHPPKVFRKSFTV